jgi:hypothetical protein
LPSEPSPQTTEVPRRESQTLSFLIKLWLDEEAGQVAWHGYITFIPPGLQRVDEDRLAVRSLDAINAFIHEKLLQMGVQFDSLSKAQHWLDQQFYRVRRLFRQ